MQKGRLLITSYFDIFLFLDAGTSRDNGADQIKRPCLFACMDQTYKTAVTTSTFPNMHTFLRGPEFCLMFRKVNIELILKIKMIKDNKTFQVFQ